MLVGLCLPCYTLADPTHLLYLPEMLPSDSPLPVSLPPPFTRPWTAAEIESLLALLAALRAAAPPASDIAEARWAALRQRLATEQGTDRYRAAVAFASKQEEGDLTYQDWLARVVAGFYRHQAEVFGVVDTPDGLAPALSKRLATMAYHQYHKVFKYPPSLDHQLQIVSAVLEALNTHYWFDVALDAWLWQTTRQVVITDLRDAIRNHTLEFDQAEQLDPASDPAGHVLHTEAFLSAIQEIANQRYRVILLLLYIYQLNNAELAAFFGVPVARAAVWLSRARTAFRAVYFRRRIADFGELSRAALDEF